MTKAGERNQVRLLGVTGRKRSELLLSTALQAASALVVAVPAATLPHPALAQPAPNARPAGGTVVAGSAAITQSANTTTINQASQRAAINWQSFNVGAQQGVAFNQPSSSAVALNRVTGPDPSQIAGRITANGQIVLVNQAGVTFYKGAQVNAQSLIVTSANVSNANFMAGNMAFDQAGSPNAAVTNQGTITVKQAGLAALVAPQVANSGQINARLGHVVLAGAKTATLDMYGDGLLALDVTNQVTKAPIGANGAKVAALVTNTGVIRADGGTVQLTAAAADGVLQHLVNAGGTITANTVGAKTGTVTIAGMGGSVMVTGLINAAGQAPTTAGGQVAVNATGKVTLASTARIDASGQAGGGTVAIGTTLQRANGGPGTASAMTARNVVVRKGATINASAGTTGNGGRVTVLSGHDTRMAGTIVARGGSQSGDGGFAEVSGDNLNLSGSVDLGAPHGIVGTLLLDPTNLVIIASTNTTMPSSIDGEFNGGTLGFGAKDGTATPSSISTKTLTTIGSDLNIVVQATGSIDVEAPISVGNGLTIQAGGNLSIGVGDSIQAGGNILLQAGQTLATGALTINADVTNTGTSGNLQLIAGTGGIAINGNIHTGLFGGTVDLNAKGGDVIQAPGVVINTTVLTSSLGVTGTVSLTGSNVVQEIGNFTVTAPGKGPAVFQLHDTAPLAVVGVLSAPGGQIFLQTSNAGGIDILAGATVTTGSTGRASFQADSFTIQPATFTPAQGLVSTGTFELAPNTPGRTVTLGEAEGGLQLQSVGNISASLVRVGAVTQPGTGSPTIIAGAVEVGSTFDAQGISLDLNANGPISEFGNPLLNVATLSGNGGAWDLSTLGNTITNIGNINSTSLLLNDSIGATITGSVNGGASAQVTITGDLAISGTVSATAVSLTADNIAITGLISGTTVGLVANVGTIDETTGTLVAGTLSGSAVGVADFLGANASVNQVGTIGFPGVIGATPPGGFSASSFALRDGVGLTIAGPVAATSATGQVFLSSTAPAGITIAATGAISANTTTGLASLQADSFVNNAAVTAATVELAPATGGATVTLGATGGGLSLTSMAGLTTTNLVIGAVTQPNGTAPVTSAGSIAITGAFTFNNAGTLTLDAASSTGAGATGAVTQTAALTGVPALSGTANSFDLTNSLNDIANVASLTATTGDLDLASKSGLTVFGASAPAGNVYLASGTGVLLDGTISALGRVGIQTDVLRSRLTHITGATFELAPITTGTTVTLGAAGASLSLVSLNGITVNTVRFGAVTIPHGATPTTTAGGVAIAGAFDATATTTLELDAAAVGSGSGAITQTAALLNLATLAASGTGVILINAGNQIDTSSGITATTGNVELVDSKNLALNGIYTGNDLFFEVAVKGGALTIGSTGPATLNAATGARISLVADSVTANVAGSIGSAGGTVELAPFSAINVSLAGGGAGMQVNAALLADINVGTGTLLVGGFTSLTAPAATLTTTAASITLDGAVDLSTRAGTLVLLANGSVTEPGGPLTVGTVTGSSVGDFFLGNAANQFQASTGITATNGNVVLVDDPTLVLTGPYSGNNLFFQVTLPGGSLALGSPAGNASLVAAPDGRISLVADQITATAGSTITAPAGTLEIAPFSAINESLAGTNGTGQLLVDSALLAILPTITNTVDTLVIGGYTDVTTGATTPTASASGVTVDGAANLTGLITNLELLSKGSVTEPGGPLTVTNVFGASVGAFSLPNPTNAIGESSGIAASAGDVVLVDGTNLALVGAHSGNNLFFEVALKGGTLQIGTPRQTASVTAASGGRITLVADQITENARSLLTAPVGTVELAPFSAINTSLLGTSGTGQLLIDPTLLSIITPGISTLVVGGFTNVPAAATTSAPSASSITVDGTVTLAPLATTLDLEATGSITQAAPLLSVGTLAASGSSVILTNAGNQIDTSSGIAATAGNIELVDSKNLALNGIYTGNDLFFEVAVKGGALTIGATGPATLTAAAGARISLVADSVTANVAGSIGNPGGTVELAPFSAINVSLAGGGAGMQINAALLADINVGTGTLVVGGFTSLTAPVATLTTTAASITLDGAVDLSTRAGTLVLLANGSVTEPGGPLTVGTVTGSSVGDFFLGNAANVIQASTGITATNGNVVLVDDPTLVLTGLYSGNNLFFQVTQPGGSLALGASAALTAATGGRISLVADQITTAAGATITAPIGTLEVAPFSLINESLLGTSSTGQLLVDSVLFSALGTGVKAVDTIVIGGFTSVTGNATTPTASASGVTLDSAVNLTGLTTNLVLLSKGSVTEPGGPLTVTNVSGASVGTFSLANSGNAINQSLGITASKGDVVLVDGTNLALIGTQSGDNLFFEVALKGGILQVGNADLQAALSTPTGGRITLVADQINENSFSSLTAPVGTVEIAPFSPINTSILGTSGTGQLLIGQTLLSIITPGISTLVVGGFTNVPVAATTSTPSASSITVDGTLTLAPLATALNLEATGSITQAAPLLSVGTLTASGSSVILTNAANQIDTSSGIIATAGNIELVDSTSLALNGAYTGDDLFFEVAAKGGALTIGSTGPATLTAAAGARISLVADSVTANVAGSIGNPGGTVELAPFSAINVSLAGGGAGMQINAALLADINVGTGTLVVGGFTSLTAPVATLTTTAASITLDGAVDLSTRAGTLVLLANGSVTEPGGPLTVGTVTGSSVGDFFLGNAANQIQASTGIIATNGNVVLADDPTLVLTGLYSGNNLFFQVTLPGGSLALGAATTPATLVAIAGGRISLVADQITATAGSTISAPAGTLEIAPFSAINESLAGTNGTGQLLVDSALLAILPTITNTVDTLVIGGYTNVTTGATTPTASASGVTVDGALNLTGLINNLELLSTGSVTEPGGPLTVTNVFGASVGAFSLPNPTNAIGESSGIAANAGDVVLVDGTNLALIGAHSGNNLFFEVALKGGTLQIGTPRQTASVTAASGGRVTLVADQITENARSVLTAPVGTVELAPFSSINTSLLGTSGTGQLLIDPTLLSIITPGISTLVVGGFTNVPAAATTSAPSAASVSVDGTLTLAPLATTLDLEATGPITQTAPLLNVGTLIATGSSVILTNPANVIDTSSGIIATAGNIELVDSTSLALNGAYTGDDLFFEVAAKGGTLTIGATGPATLTPGTAARISLVADNLSANVAGSIGNGAGTVELAPFSPINVSLAGAGNGMLINAALLADINVGSGLLLIGGFTNLPANTTAITTSAGSVTLDGPVDLTGRASRLQLLANGSVTEPGGPLTVVSVSGASGGDFTLDNAANQIGSSGGITAANGDIVLVDNVALSLGGGFSANNLFFQVNQPGASLTLGGLTLPATLAAAPEGRITLVADQITATPSSTITAPAGTLEVAPFSEINVSVGGTNGAGQLLVDSTLLSDVGTLMGTALNMLVIGGYTNVTENHTAPAASASGVTLDGALNLTPLTNSLELLSDGTVTEPGGPLTVPNVSGASVGTFSLANPGNAINQSLGITAAKGDVVLVDGTSLALVGPHSGGNLFFEVAAQGGTLQVGNSDQQASLTAGSGGRITLVADRITENARSTLTAPIGTVEVAPFSSINTSVLGSTNTGQLLLDPTLLSIITPGISTLVVGGFTNVPSGATASAPSAASVTIDGTLTLAPLATTLDLEASGAVSQAAPIVNVGTLLGNTGSTTLNNSGNIVGTLGNYIATNGFALTNAANLLIAGAVQAGPSASFTVNGALTETGSLTAATLTGSAAGNASFTGLNIIAQLDGFTVSGGASTFTLNDRGALSIGGTLSASHIVVSDPLSQVSLGDGASIVTGGSRRPPGIIPPATLLPQNGAPGAWIQAASFTQIGRSTVTSLTGGPSSLQITVTGNMQFDPPVGLFGNNTWLTLNLTNGFANGDVFVNALDVTYTQPGGTNLFGSIDGVSSVFAARLGFIQPAPDRHYLFNDCEIAASVCALATVSIDQPPLPGNSTVFVPLDALLALIAPALVLDPEDKDDLLQMPVVSTKDY